MSLSKILFVFSVPAVRHRFFDYGPRATERPDNQSTSPRKTAASSPSQHNVTAGDPIATLLDRFASYRVPHGWFIHFYLLSTGLSALWAYRIWYRGLAFEFLAVNSGVQLDNAMSTNQVALAWCLMLMQGLRRLVECVIFAKRSSSQMWIGHWILGLLFYAFMSVSVWIEGSGMYTIYDLLLGWLTMAQLHC